MLLLEFNKTSVETLGRKTFVTGPFLVGDVVNKNNRFYPSRILEAAVETIRPQIKEGTLLGQLGHPETLNGDPTRISHVITSLERKGSTWIGKARIIDEGAGKVAQSIIDAGGRLGISSRGMGETKTLNGHQVITENFKLQSF